MVCGGLIWGCGGGVENSGLEELKAGQDRWGDKQGRDD